MEEPQLGCNGSTVQALIQFETGVWPHGGGENLRKMNPDWIIPSGLDNGLFEVDRCCVPGEGQA